MKERGMKEPRGNSFLDGLVDLIEEFFPQKAVSIKDEFVQVIPKPVEVQLNSGYFTFNRNTVIICNQDVRQITEYLKELLEKSTGYIVDIMSQESDYKPPYIKLELESNLEINNEEGYVLNIEEKSIKLKALSNKGLFNGIQTIRQLFPPEINLDKKTKSINWRAPCVNITDYPRFSWRGFMLDESRNFFGKEVVKTLLEVMAFLKMNTFHWHLTDDQGWRIQIRKYPNLTDEVSKKKVGSGFYTQKDITEIVDFAKSRFIKIIPEIDMPAHCSSAILSYPFLSCKDSSIPPRIPLIFRIFGNAFCAGNKDVYLFLKDVLNEVMNLFPSKYLHIGGDELIKKNWENCSLCQSLIREKGLIDEDGLRTYFLNQFGEYIASQDRIPIVWNDAIDEKLSSNFIVQFWKSKKKATLKELRSGRKFVMSDFYHTYLNYHDLMIPLSKSYNYNPIPRALEPKFHENIIGIEACMWTQWTLIPPELYSYVFPRLIAIAENAWTLEHLKEFQLFKSRVIIMLKQLKMFGIYKELLDFDKLNLTDSIKRRLDILYHFFK